MSKPRKQDWNLTLVEIGYVIAYLILLSPNNPWTSMEEQDFNSNQKAKVALLDEYTSKIFLNPSLFQPKQPFTGSREYEFNSTKETKISKLKWHR